MLLILVSIVLSILLILSAYLILAPQFGRNPDKARLQCTAVHSRYKDGKFTNEKKVPVILPRSQLKLLQMIFAKNERRIPPHLLPSSVPDFSLPLDDNKLGICWLGHSSVYIRLSGITILTDPVFSKRASPMRFMGPRSFEYTTRLSPELLPKPDIIIVSHDHFDHLDYHTIKNYFRDTELFVIPLGIRDHLERWGIKPGKIIEFDWWQEEQVFDELRITCTPAQHFSGRRRQSNATLWSSWVIGHKKMRVFFSGDSGYGEHFKLIGEKYGPFNAALLECGAYGKYWPHIHMIPEETVQAGIDLQAKTVLPVHWGKYNLAFHAWDEPIERFVAEAASKNLPFFTSRPGEVISLPGSLPQNTWWKRAPQEG